jgi:hypothetical protein
MKNELLSDIDDVRLPKIAQFIATEKWGELCEFLRMVLEAECPEYRKSESESIIGCWVSRMIIVSRQTADRVAHPIKPLFINPSPAPYTEAERQAEINSEIVSKWHSDNDEFAVYARHLRSWDGVPAAELKVAETLKRVGRKGGA